MNPQFADPLAKRLDVAGQSVAKTIQPGGNDAANVLVLESDPPRPEDLGLLELDQGVLL